MADDRVLDEARLSAVGGDHHSLSRLCLDGQGCLTVGLNQSVDREALGLHRDALGVHLHSIKVGMTEDDKLNLSGSEFCNSASFADMCRSVCRDAELDAVFHSLSENLFMSAEAFSRINGTITENKYTESAQ